MNSRGQAALEYLMTYGWALVIIVVVAGILFFIMSSPAGNVVCNSSDPAKIPIQASNIAKTGTPSIKIINGTAGNITTMTFGVSGASNSFSAPITRVPAGATSLNSGAVLELQPTCAICAAGTTLGTNTSIDINYTDQFAYAKSVKITCQGTPGPST